MILCATCGKEIELKQQITSLKSQLANIKYLNADEVEKIFNDCLPEDFNFEEEKILTMTDQENIIQAICNLAIPDIDSDKIIKILHEFVVYQIEADNLINNEAVEYVADEIIKAIRGEK